MYVVRSFARTLHLAGLYPRAFIAWLLKPILQETRSFDAKAKREVARQKGESVGWLEGHKTFKLFGRIPLFTLDNEEETSAQHFYFARPQSPVRKAFVHSGLKLPKNPSVFEPGCGCGKNLYYFQDQFGASIHGIDIFAPAIEVAKKANIYGRAEFQCQNILKEGLGHIADKAFDLVIVNSYFAHIDHLPEFQAHLDELVRVGKHVLVLERRKDNVLIELHKRGFRPLKSPKLLMVK